MYIVVSIKDTFIVHPELITQGGITELSRPCFSIKT